MEVEKGAGMTRSGIESSVKLGEFALTEIMTINFSLLISFERILCAFI